MPRFIPTAAAAIAALLAIAPAIAPAWAEPPPIKLGVLTDLAGPYSDATGAGSVLAAQMAVEDCLAAECKGMHIEVVSGDHQNKPDVGLSIARTWVDRDGVDAFLDMSNSAIQLAMASFVAEKDRVALFSGGTARLTGDACQPAHAVQWMWDTYAQVGGVAGPLTKPGTRWFLVAADYAFGLQFEADARQVIGAAGGSVIGSVRHPFPSPDMSAFLLQAQASGADIIALANAGPDTLNGIKAASEFGLGRPGSNQRLVALLLAVGDVKALGLAAAAGTTLSEGFYWDIDDGTRRFSRRFFAKRRAMPSQIQAGVYSAALHYLKSVAAEGGKDPERVLRRMRTIPIQDDVVRHASLRPDGRMVHDWYVFEVKHPDESNGEWDLYKLVDTVPGDVAFRPLAAGGCPRLLAP